MTLASLVNRPPTSPIDAAKERSAPGRVSGRLRVALTAMVWQGLKRAEAAEKAKMSEHSLYVALRRPHVKAWYLSELDLLRTSERARNIFALTEVRDGTNQMARVAAVKALEQLSEETQGRSGASIASPGMTVVIVNGSPPQPVIDVTPIPKTSD